jgi:hypothetical protein
MAAIRDQFVTARKAATRLGLDDAREGRERRTPREVVTVILNGAAVAPDIEGKLYEAYRTVFDPLIRFGSTEKVQHNQRK